VIRAFRDHLFEVAFSCVPLAGLSARVQAIIQCMIEGRSGSKIARKLKLQGHPRELDRIVTA